MKKTPWTRNRALQVVRKYAPNESLNSSRYKAFYETHKGLVPSPTRLLDLFGSWEAIQLAIWGAEPSKSDWDKSRCKQALRAEFKEPIGLQAYAQLVKGNKRIPTVKKLYEIFGSWPDVVSGVWGSESTWTQERITNVLLSHFKEAPSQHALAALAKEKTELPSPYHCKKAFGSYRHMVEVVFNGLSYSEERGGTRRRYDQQTLISLMRQCFETRPQSVSTYKLKTKAYDWMPTANTYLNQFGSWEQAMKACYPEISQVKTPGRWTKENTKTAVATCYEASGGHLSAELYRKWAINTPDTPSLSTVINYWGELSSVAKSLDIPLTQLKTSWTQEQVKEALIRYTTSYPAEQWTYGDYGAHTDGDYQYPSRNTILRHYRSIREAFADVADYNGPAPRQERITKEACLSALKQAHEAIGDPLSRERYLTYRQSHQELPARLSITSHFGSWAKALDAAGLNKSKDTPRKVILTSLRLDVEGAPVTSLADMLTHCLK